MPKRTAVTISAGQPAIDPLRGAALLRQQIETGKKLWAAGTNEDEYSTWEMLTRNYLEKAFGRGSSNVSTITDVGKYGSFPMEADDFWWANHRRSSLGTQLSKLEGLVELLATEAELRVEHVVTTSSATGGRRVFLVHGHDERALHETARFLEKLEQDVIVLREQPNQGRTVIEKFEDYSDVGFAIVLLTPDDRGGSADASFDTQRQRARQNVIFELGYFIGRLGRNRVCALYRQGIEIPSDYAGVVYQELDENGAWRFQVAKELKSAGFEIDMNKAL